MDEKLTPADVLRKGISAVADAENKGINVEKDIETSFSIGYDDDAVEFSSFSIDDTRDTAPGSKAGTRLPTVSMTSAKVPLPEEQHSQEHRPQNQPVRKTAPEEPKEMEDIYSHSETHSRTWLRNHEGSKTDTQTEAPHNTHKNEPRIKKTQEELLAEIMAETPEDVQRRKAAKEEGVKLAQDIFLNKDAKRKPSRESVSTAQWQPEAELQQELPPVSEPTRVIGNEDSATVSSLEHFLERQNKTVEPASNRSEPAGKWFTDQKTTVIPDLPQSPDNRPQNQSTNPRQGGYFGVGAKSGFSQEAVAAARGGRVVENETAVDPTTLSRKELREYNRVNRYGGQVKPRRKRRLKVWQRILIIFLALIIIIVGVAAGFFGRYYGLLGDLELGDNPIQRISSDEQSELNQKTMNILLVGLDSRKDNYTGRSDSMILCTINKKSKKLVMTSFLRDSYVNIPGHGKNKMNAAYALGGSNLLAKTIYKNYGIVVDRIAVFNFLFVIDVIDYLGGVTVDVSAEELPYLNMYVHDQNQELYNLANPNKGQINTGAGTYNLTGIQALAYARIRYVGTDFARTERQRYVLSECIEKCEQLSAGELNKMLKTFLPRIKTDLTSGDFFSLMTTLLNADNYKIVTMAIPTDGTWTNTKVGSQDVIKINNFKANTKAWEKAVE